MKITAKGQVTIPVTIREQAGLLPETEVEFEYDGNAVRLRKSRKTRIRGRSIVNRLKGTATSGMTTDEILNLTRG